MNIVRPSVWESWQEALENDTTVWDDTPKLACNVCGKKCETLLASRGGGNLTMHNGDNDVMEWWKAPNPWIHSADPNVYTPWQFPNNEGSRGSGGFDERESTPLPMDMPQIDDLNCEPPKWRNQNRCMMGYPTTDYEWGEEGDLNRIALQYHTEAQQEFSVEAATDLAACGNRLVESTGSLDLALMAFQEVEFRKLKPQRDYINQNRTWIPQLADEMEEIMRIGVTATYNRPAPAHPCRKGLPYKDKDTLEIVEKLWSDIKKGRIFYLW